eukprot:jgi/Botrbrau1/21808/Bobra.0190s0028.1
MPALVLFGRRWAIASDDIPALALPPTVLHGLWIIIIVVMWVFLEDPWNLCGPSVRYIVIFAGISSSCTLQFLLGCWMMWEGLKGSVFDVGKRWRVPYLLYAVLVVGVAELSFLGYGTYVIFTTMESCPTRSPEVWTERHIILVLVWITWAMAALVGILLVATYNTFPNYQDPKSWERRCWCCTAVCCCQWYMHGRDDEDVPPYIRLAYLFQQLFGHLDLAPTDVVLLFLLEGQMQKWERQMLARRVLLSRATSPTTTPPTSDNSGEGGDVDQSLIDIERGEGMDPLFQRSQGGAGCSTRTSLLVPTGWAIEYRPDLDPREAVLKLVGDYDTVSDRDLSDAAHFVKYAFGAYGYMLYLWSKPQHRGCCELMCGRSCGLITGPIRRYPAGLQALQLAAGPERGQPHEPRGHPTDNRVA